MSEAGRIRTIAVAGGGVVGVSAALAFARALPDAKVELIDLAPPGNALADRMTGTLPAIRHFHRLVGIGEPELVREAGTGYRIGTRFDQWSADGEPWYHCFGRHGAQLKSSPFQHQWARARRAGRALPFDLYAPAAAMARSNKFVHPVEDQRSLLASFDYALRLDPEPYRQLLIRRATGAGVRTRDGSISDAQVGADGRLACLVMADGSRVEADLFIDCAGPSAPILSLLDDRFDDWSEYLPCDRLLLTVEECSAPSPVDEFAATDSGWRCAIPLLATTLRAAAFCSAITKEADAHHVHAPNGEAAELVAIRPGRRPDAWVRNVIAFGDAAVAVDPLESCNLYLAQSAIHRAVSLLPGADFQPLALREYNRRTRAETERVRDFIAVHYLATRRDTGAFWQAMKGRKRPDSLAHALEQFEGRGRLAKFEEESFEDDSWLAVLLGLGLEPRRIDPTADMVDFEESIAMLDQMARMSASVPVQLPDFLLYLAQLKAG